MPRSAEHQKHRKLLHFPIEPIALSLHLFHIGLILSLVNAKGDSVHSPGMIFTV